MGKIWNPQKHIPLYTRSDFKSTWQTIVKEPYPGLLIGTGFLTPTWINKRGHSEREYQRCIIHHWPSSLVPGNISKNDKLADLIPAILDLLKNLGQDQDGKQKQLIGDAGNFLYQSFKFLTQGPLKGLPLIDFLNPDRSLTFIYANWYEGTPTNLHWVMDVNWTRYNRISLQNEQLHQLDDAPELLLGDNFPEVPAAEAGDLGFVSLPESMEEVFAGNTSMDSKTEATDEFSTARGIFKAFMTTDGSGEYLLLHPSSEKALLTLKSGELNLDRLPEFVDDSLVEVSGTKVHSLLPVHPGQPLFTLFVDTLTVLKTDSEIHFPAIEITEDLLEPEGQESMEMAGRTCPTDVRKKISAEGKDIEAAAKRLKKVNWKKFGTIAGMVGGLIGATISAAMTVASTAGWGTPVAATLLFAKVTALYQATSMLTALDNSAKKDLKIMNKAKDNLKSLKRKHPACFK